MRLESEDSIVYIVQMCYIELAENDELFSLCLSEFWIKRECEESRNKTGTYSGEGLVTSWIVTRQRNYKERY